MLTRIREIAEEERPARRPVTILGSTGSIGKAALDIVRKEPGLFYVSGLAAGSDAAGLAAQIREFRPARAAVADPDKFSELQRLCTDCHETELSAGREAVAELAGIPGAEVVLAAVVGVAGLPPVVRALEAGKTVALANKESVVAGGRLLEGIITRTGARIVPVDSEHSAIFQALQGHRTADLERLILTASGGPFLNTPAGEFRNIRPEQALRHPNWSMGAKITIDSATMVNKGLELIEAAWLFGAAPEQIAVLVHPQSIVHSLVAFVDGSQLAQLSHPDMRGPIAYALSYPGGRVRGVMQGLRLEEIRSLQFLPVDSVKFPAVELARECLKAGGAMPAVFNAANEVSVEKFLSGRLTFDRIVAEVAAAVDRFAGADYHTLEELLEVDARVRAEMN